MSQVENQPANPVASANRDPVALGIRGARFWEQRPEDGDRDPVVDAAVRGRTDPPDPGSPDGR